MKKLLFLIPLISTPIFAAKPLPEACQAFISISEPFFKEVVEKQPEKADQAEKMLEMLSSLQKEWDELQNLQIDQNAKPEQQNITAIMKESGEKIFADLCQKKLKDIQEVIEAARKELK